MEYFNTVMLTLLLSNAHECLKIHLDYVLELIVFRLFKDIVFLDKI